MGAMRVSQSNKELVFKESLDSNPLTKYYCVVNSYSSFIILGVLSFIYVANRIKFVLEYMFLVGIRWFIVLTCDQQYRGRNLLVEEDPNIGRNKSRVSLWKDMDMENEIQPPTMIYKLSKLL